MSPKIYYGTIQFLYVYWSFICVFWDVPHFVVIRGERAHSIQKRQREKKVSEREDEQRMIGLVLLNVLSCQGLSRWLMCCGDYRLYIEEALERSF